MNILQSVNKAILDAMATDPSVLLCGQLVKYGLGGLTAGAFELRPNQVITYPVCESLMNASAMGLALAGMRPIVVHERMDFLAVGMDALVNHIPIWPKRQKMSLPLVILTIVGKGHGQGPQHSKNFIHWFQDFEGWSVFEPEDPEGAYSGMRWAVEGDKPVLYVLHREFFNATGTVSPLRPDKVGLCGASKAFEDAFYSNPFRNQ